MNTNDKVLDEKLAELERARPRSPRVISKLEALIRTGTDAALHRVDPLEFAEARGIQPREATDLFLHAAKIGLLRMNWHLLCPKCGAAVESFATLRNLHGDYYCSLCEVAVQAALDDYVQVSFTIAPAVRGISYHNPGDLDAKDYVLNYRFSRQGRFAPGGPRFIDFVASGALSFERLEPQSQTVVRWEVPAGFLKLAEVTTHLGAFARVTAEAAARVLRMSIRPDKVSWEPEAVAPGALEIQIDYQPSERGAFVGFHMPPDMEIKSEPLYFDPFLKGSDVLSSQTFRNLYRGETVRGGDGIGVRDVSIVFTDLKGSTAMYERVGDLKAFTLVQQHFDRLTEAITEEGGATVKTIGDAVMASFTSPLAAVRAARRMIELIGAFNASHADDPLILKVGVHRGAAIAVTLNEAIDFFGQTVNIAARVEGLAGANEIYMTRDVFGAPGVPEYLAGLEIEERKAQLKGVAQEMPVFRVRTGAALAA